MATTTNSISRTVRLCRWQTHVNSLWLWAYCFLTLVVQGYLLYRAVTRCKQYNELPWRSDDKPVTELYVYIGLIVVSVMCVPFFIITSVFKVKNYSGDGVRLGRDNIHESELAEAASAIVLPDPKTSSTDLDGAGDKPGVRSAKASLGGRFHTLWNRVGPLAHGFHVLSAFSLLLPSFLLDAQEIRYGFQNPESTWRSELDFLLSRQRYPPPAASPARLVQYTPLDSTTEDALDAPSPQDPGTPHTLTPEYVNYVLALLLYGVRYAAVFWYTKMSFSLVFALQMLVITLHFAFSFCGVGVLYKFQVNAGGFDDLELVLPPAVTLVLFLAANSSLLLCGLAMFNYGLLHYRERWRAFLRAYAPSVAKTQPRESPSCHGYCPHVLATVLLLLVICCRGPIVYDFVLLYRKTGFAVILGSIVLDAVFMVTWIALWFVLTIKQTWDFRIMFARYVQPAKVGTTKTSDKSGSRGDVAGAVVPDIPSTAEVKTNGTIQTGTTEDSSTATAQKKPSRRSTNGHHQKVKFDSEAKLDDAKKPSDSKESTGAEKTTPDSTLTRSYRHSIRDKCGQYYRISREVTPPPPAAQSSPKPPVRPTDGVLLDPRAAAADNNPRHDYAANGVPLRYSRGPPRPPDSSRYSYPLIASLGQPPTAQSPARQPLPRSARRSLQLERPFLANVHEGSYLATSDLYLGPDVPPTPPRRPPRPADTTPRGAAAHRLKARKPDLAQRDSALPSSQESSDSNDVLCSQV